MREWTLEGLEGLEGELYTKLPKRKSPGDRKDEKRGLGELGLVVLLCGRPCSALLFRGLPWRCLLTSRPGGNNAQHFGKRSS